VTGNEDNSLKAEEGSRGSKKMEVTMRRLIVAMILLATAVLFGALQTPSMAASAGSYSKLPEQMQVLKPGVQLVGYKYCDYNGCYYCQYRECDSYSYCGYGHKCCSHFSYSDCSGYGGGGGGGGYGYHHHHYQGGGGGY
jgi:hypothetical protein